MNTRVGYYSGSKDYSRAVINREFSLISMINNDANTMGGLSSRINPVVDLDVSNPYVKFSSRANQPSRLSAHRYRSIIIFIIE